jgi:hypothetical protein
MSSRARICAAIGAALMGLASGPLWAPTYKWVDEKGIVHYGDKIPPEYANKANTEIGTSGVTVRKNEGQLTPEQLQVREAEQKKKDDEKKRALEVARRNKALLTTYNSEEEIDRAREKSLQQAEDTIRGIQQKMIDTQQRQRQMQKEADSYKGKKVPADLLGAIEDADADLRINQQLVVAKRKELDAIRAKFDEEKRIYAELTRGSGAAGAPTETGGKSK